MDTDALIRALAADLRPAPAGGLAQLDGRLAGATGLGAALVVAAVLAGFGLRGDFAHAALTAHVALKLILATGLAGLAYPLLRRLAQPDLPLPRWAALAPLWPALVLAAAAVTGRHEPTSAAACAAVVALLSLAPLGLILVALRAGAPNRPALAGGVAGILAGALAASGYALFCPLDFTPTVALFYLAGIAAAAGLGLLFGKRALAW